MGGAQEKPTNVDYVLFSQYDFSSPLFWISEGEFFGRSEFAVRQFAGDIGSSKPESFTNTSLSLQQAFRYGITDDLTAEALLEEIPSAIETFHPSGSGSFKERSDGWVDPVFYLSYRTLYQPRDPFYSYFYIGYAPDLFSARAPTSTRNGTVAVGASQVFLESLLGVQTGEYTFQFAAIATHTGDTDVSGVHRDGGWDGQIDLEMFDVINDRWSYDINAGGSRGTLFAEAELNYFIVPQKLQISGFYEHSWIRDVDSGFGQLRNQREDLVGIRFKYLFDLTHAAR